MTPTVVLDAAPFCYGPISTLLAVARQLARYDLELVLLATGTALEFAGDAPPWLRVVPCNTEDPAELARVAPLLRRAAVFVCNTNPPGAVFAHELGCRVAYIDTLFWMWNRIDPRVAASELYFAQDFTGVADNYQRLGHAIRNFEVVGPLIADCDDPAALPRANTCIVSFGGMESTLTVPGERHRYPWIMTELVLDALAQLPPFDRVVFCGRGWVMRSLAERFGGPRRQFGFVPHAELMRELARCRLLLLSPGLTGAFEALALNVDACALLAQNYSQQLQARMFLRRPRPVFRGLAWDDLYSDFELPNYLDEALAIDRLDQLIRRFEADTAMQVHYRDRLVACLREPRDTARRAAPGSAAQRVAAQIAALALGGARHEAARP